MTITEEIIDSWDEMLQMIIDEIKQLRNKNLLLKLYTFILNAVVMKELDPLQLATFDLIVACMANTIMLPVMQAPDLPITPLIDDVCDIHFEFVEKFSKGTIVLSNKGDDEEEQSDYEQLLHYQFAGLARKIYETIAVRLGGGFDKSDDTQRLRISNWVGPVYARMQRRLNNFSSDYVEEKLEESTNVAFRRLLNKLKLRMIPRYHLLTYSTRPSLQPVEGVVQRDSGQLPCNRMTNLFSKVIRNVVSGIDMNSLEYQLMSSIRDDLSTRLRPLGRKLESIHRNRRALLEHSQVMILEDAINIGHECLAAVLILWQIRYNIVGVIPVPKEEDDMDRRYPSSGSSSPPLIPVKDFLLPVNVSSVDKVMESIPKVVRVEVRGELFHIRNILSSARYAPRAAKVDIERLEGLGALSFAIRSFAAKEFRSLITYQSDSSEWPDSRDASYMAILTAILTEALSAPTYDVEWLHENLLACVALEETIGTEEPRRCCRESFETALSISATRSLSKTGGSSIVKYDPERVDDIELLLSIILRLPEGVGERCRMNAFKAAINRIMDESISIGQTGIDKIHENYPQIAQQVGISETAAYNYIRPLGEQRFDKSIGSILMDADMAINMPDLGDMFLKQIYDLSKDLMMEPSDATKRVTVLVAVIFTSMIEVAMEEKLKSNRNRSEQLLRRAFNLYQHPLLLSLDADLRNKYLSDSPQSGQSEDTPRVSGLMMTAFRTCYDKFSSSNSMMNDLIRAVDDYKQRISNSFNQRKRDGDGISTEGWGYLEESNSNISENLQQDGKILEFLKSFQTYLVKEYSTKMLRGIGRPTR